MDRRAHALELAVALSSRDESAIGPTDSALCVEALQYYARHRLHQYAVRRAALPTLVAAATIGLIALLGSAQNETTAAMVPPISESSAATIAQ